MAVANAVDAADHRQNSKAAHEHPESPMRLRHGRLGSLDRSTHLARTYVPSEAVTTSSSIKLQARTASASAPPRAPQDNHAAEQRPRKQTSSRASFASSRSRARAGWSR